MCKLFGGTAYDTFDTTARQVGQPVGIQEREAIFEWVFATEAGREGCDRSRKQLQALADTNVLDRRPVDGGRVQPSAHDRSRRCAAAAFKAAILFSSS